MSANCKPPTWGWIFGDSPLQFSKVNMRRKLHHWIARSARAKKVDPTAVPSLCIEKPCGSNRLKSKIGLQQNSSTSDFLNREDGCVKKTDIWIHMTMTYKIYKSDVLTEDHSLPNSRHDAVSLRWMHQARAASKLPVAQEIWGCHGMSGRKVSLILKQIHDGMDISWNTYTSNIFQLLSFSLRFLRFLKCICTARLVHERC